MAQNINQKTVSDFDTGEQLPQHKMLQRFMEKTGVTRKQLHLATKGKSNPESSATWLSDIVNGGERHLPMRYIAPLIEAFNLTKNEERHYIAEFFKGHCDEKLQYYIKSSRPNLKIATLEHKVEELESQNTALIQNIFFEKNVTNNKTIHALQNKIVSLRSELIKLQRKIAPLEPKPEDFEDDYDYFQAKTDWETDRFESAFELETERWEEHFRDPIEELYEECETSFHESEKGYEREKKAWLNALAELEKMESTHPKLMIYVKTFLPESFCDDLKKFLQDDGAYYGFNDPVDSWAWMKHRIHARPHNYVLVSLLKQWKKKNVNAFYHLDEFYETYFSLEPHLRSKFKREKGEKTSLMNEGMKEPISSMDDWFENVARRKMEREKARDKAELVEGVSFSTFLSRCHDLMRRRYSNLYRILMPVKPYHIINHSKDEELVFQLLKDYENSELYKHYDFFEFYEGQFPSLARSKANIAEVIAELVCYFPLNGKKLHGASLQYVFNFYGDAELKYENASEFFAQNITDEKTLIQKLILAKRLAEKQMDLGISQSYEKSLNKIRDAAESMHVPNFKIDY